MIQTCGYTVDCQHTGYDWLPSWTSLDPVVHAGCHLRQLHCLSVIYWTRRTQKGNVCTPSYVGFCWIVPSCNYSEIFYSPIVNCNFLLTIWQPKSLQCFDTVGWWQEGHPVWTLWTGADRDYCSEYYSVILSYNVWMYPMASSLQIMQTSIYEVSCFNTLSPF